MTEIVPIDAVEIVLFGVLKIRWRDGFAGIVDLRPVLAEGDMFAFLRDRPERFNDVHLEEHGHKVYWLDEESDEIDFGAYSLRKRAERQAEILRLAS